MLDNRVGGCVQLLFANTLKQVATGCRQVAPYIVTDAIRHVKTTSKQIFFPYVRFIRWLVGRSTHPDETNRVTAEELVHEMREIDDFTGKTYIIWFVCVF